MPASFPGNPPPLDTLPPLGEASCASCHYEGYAGRFPQVSATETPRYCAEVLAVAVGTGATMPPEGGSALPYLEQVQWLLAACGVTPDPGQPVRFQPPPLEKPMPPEVQAPFACTRSVTVEGALPGATLELWKKGESPEKDVLLFQTVATGSPDGTVLEVKKPFEVGDKLEVHHIYQGQPSDPVTVDVLDPDVVFPGELPAPTIAPRPIYQCATTVAVQNIPGATVALYKSESTSGGFARSRESNGASTAFRMDTNGPFDIGDSFMARQQLCDRVSPFSEEAPVVSAPTTLSPITFDPPVDGQRFLALRGIVQGSGVSLDRTNPPMTLLDVASHPYRRLTKDLKLTPLGAASAGDQFLAQQSLCKMQSNQTHGVTVQACDQDYLDDFYPSVVPPWGGQEVVVVTQAVPGAVIRVFRAVGTNYDDAVEIGNSTSLAVPLSEALVAGDGLLITQQLESCMPSFALSITVQ